MKLAEDARFIVRDICGIEALDETIPHGQPIEIVGRNAAGKTSAALALMATAARDPNPRSVAATIARKVYVRDGASPDEARATLKYGADVITWRPASATIEDTAGGRVSSAAAVGLVDWTAQRSARERAALLQSVLVPDPNAMLSKVRSALADMLPEEDVRGVMEEIGRRGWEAAEEIYRSRARDAKRQWNAVTHRVYGTKAADDWRPDGWSADMDTLTVIDAESALLAARNALNSIIAVHTVTEDQREAAQRAVENLPAKAKAVEEAAAKIEKARQEAARVREAHEDTRAKIAELQRVERAVREMDANPQHCPSCEAALVVSAQGQIIPARVPIDEDRQKAADARSQQTTLRTTMDREVAAAETNVAGAVSALAQERILVQRLESIAGDADASTEAHDVSGAEAAVERAREQLTMVKAKAEAQRAHETVTKYLAAADAIGPRGPRSRMIEAALRRMQAGLRVVAETAQWPVTEVDAEGALTVAGRPVSLSSESEKWRAQAAMQLTAAATDESGLVVLDRADLLDQENRAGLGAALARVCQKTGITVVVCATGDATMEGAIHV